MLNSFFKGFFRNLRDGGISSAAWYLSAPQIKSHIKKLVQGCTPSPQEVHILAGNDRITMALWMAASWISVTGKYWRFVFHDDGRLGSKMGDKLQHLLPGCKVILDTESRETMRAALAGYPLAWRCRNLHPLCRKLFDIPHFAEEERFLAIDTDIIFFHRPEKLLHLINSSEGCSVFLRDASDWTLPEAFDAAQTTGVELVRQVNTGIVAMPKSALDLQTIEFCLRQSRLLDAPRWFIEQSLYALLASRQGSVKLLPSFPDDVECYQNDLRSCALPSAVMRHYVGKVRHLFYREGIPSAARLIKNKLNILK